MSAAGPRLMERSAELRLAFDRAFAEPRRIDTKTEEDLLAIRVGTQAYAMRLSEITGLFADKRITQVPGSEAALLGIAGFRGVIVPVYCLQSLLGLDHAAAQTPRWLVMAKAAPLALAFEAFEGQLRVPPDTILPHQSRAGLPSYAREFVRMQDLTRPILHLSSVLVVVKTQRPEVGPTEER